MVASTRDLARGRVAKPPKAAAEPAIEGCIDEVTFSVVGGWVARGWAVNRGDPKQKVEVEIVEGDAVLGRGRAAQFREDLRQAGIGNGAVAFTIRLPPEVGELEEHQLSLRVTGDGVLFVPPRAVQIKRFAGHVDGVAGFVLGGWAYDAVHVGVPVALEILIDGEFAGHAVADQFRPDLAEMGFASAYHGFEWVLPQWLADAQGHRLSVRVATTEILLDGAATDVLLLPDQLGSETRHQIDLYEDTRRRLSIIAHSLKTQERQLNFTHPQTIIDVLLDSLHQPPVFETMTTPVSPVDK